MMKKLVLLIISILVIGMVAGCGEAEIYTDPEQTINVRVNQEFIIATSSNPPTGFMWREDYDESMFELVTSTFEVSEAVKKGEAEIGLEQHFRFKALKKGETEITINLAGPDLTWITDKKAFSVSVE